MQRWLNQSCCRIRLLRKQRFRLLRKQRIRLLRKQRQTNTTTTLVQPPLQRSPPCSVWSSTEVSAEHTRGYPDRQSHVQTTDPSAD